MTTKSLNLEKYENYTRAFTLLTNSQARELGYNPDERRRTLCDVFHRIKNLHFVGVTEKLQDSANVLKSQLGWSLAATGREYFTNIDAGNERSYAERIIPTISNERIEKLEQIQLIDLMIYSLAKLRWSSI
jgi:hypothetical protein